MADWSIHLHTLAADEIAELDEELRARYVHIARLLIANGPQHVGMPHVRHLRDKLWEMRLKGKNKIARVIYFTDTGQKIIVLHAFVKKKKKTPKRHIEIAKQRMD